MMNWLLLIVIVILIISLIYGAKKGALRMVYRALSWLFIILFMMVVTPRVDTFLINDTGIDEWITQKTEEYAADRWENVQQQIQERNGNVKIPKTLQDAMEQATNTLENTYHHAGEQLQQAEEQAKHSVITEVSNTLTGYVMRGIAALLTFMIAKIIVWIIGIFVKAADQGRFIGGISHTVGAVLGLGIGFLYVSILMYVIDCFFWTRWGMTLSQMLDASTFLKFLDAHNLIRFLIAGRT